jgi:bacteriophage N4 adsorption protein B
VFRAWRLFLVHIVTGKRLAWDKTMHDFPSADGLRNTRQNLGELLLSWQAIDQRKLEIALNDERAREAPLGRVLMARGWLDEETLAEAIAFQSDLPRGKFDAAALQASRGNLPISVLVRMRVLPQGLDENGHMVFVAASLPADDALDELHELTGHTATVHIVRESEVAEGLRVLRGVGRMSFAVAEGADQAANGGNGNDNESDGDNDNDTDDNENEAGHEPVGPHPAVRRGVPLIGDLLIELGLVTRAAFEKALNSYRPERDGRIGDYMVARQVISREALRIAMAEQRRIQQEQAGRQ